MLNIQNRGLIRNYFSPLQLGPVLWLDADDSSTIQFSSGSNVEQWSDKSGNNNHATQTTLSRQPTFSSSSIFFDGSNWLDHNELFLENFSVFFVIESTENYNNGGNAVYYICGGDLSDSYFNSGKSSIAFFDELQGGSGNYNDGFGVLKKVSVTDPLFTPLISNIYPSIINQKKILIFEDNKLFQNNNEVQYSDYDFSTSTAYGPPGSTANSYISRLGARVDFTLQIFHGFMYEIIYFNKQLNTEQRTQISNYLNKKWNVY